MAGGKGAAFESSMLALIFTGTAIANIAQNASSPLTNLYIALHTASPGASGSQITNEAAYTSYARVGVPRTSSGWTISTNTVLPNVAITFPTATGGSETETYWSIGTAATGAGGILYWGPITPVISVSNGVGPYLTVGSMVTEN